MRTANATIFAQAQSQPELKGMGTTCAALAICDREAFVAHVGDSRVYRVRPREVERLTHDHSSVQRMVDGGLITAAQAESHPESNVLIRCIGAKPEVEPEVRGPEVVLPGDRFVLCCDGLWGLVKAEEIAAMVSAFPPQEAVERLIALANDRGGHDNISVQVLHRTDRHSATGKFCPDKFHGTDGPADHGLPAGPGDSRIAATWSKVNRLHAFLAGVAVGVVIASVGVLLRVGTSSMPREVRGEDSSQRLERHPSVPLVPSGSEPVVVPDGNLIHGGSRTPLEPSDGTNMRLAEPRVSSEGDGISPPQNIEGKASSDRQTQAAKSRGSKDDQVKSAAGPVKPKANETRPKRTESK